MSVNIENRKTRSTESFEVRANETLQQPTKSPSRLPVEYLGIPLVDNDLAGNEVGHFFCSLRGIAIIMTCPRLKKKGCNDKIVLRIHIVHSCHQPCSALLSSNQPESSFYEPCKSRNF
jgi:hypothetical protein